MGNSLLTFPPICHCSLIRVVLALVPSGCALLAWIITTTLTFECPLAKAPLPALQEPLLGETSTSHAHISGSPRSAPWSIRERRRNMENHGITVVDSADQKADVEELEVITAAEPEHTLWQMLGHAMVGRWGSIRPAGRNILQ